MVCVFESHLEELSKKDREELALEDNWPLTFVNIKCRIIPSASFIVNLEARLFIVGLL